MKTAILCISDPYLVRGLQLKDCYEAMGDEVRVFTPDFSHRHKAPIEHAAPGVELIHHLPYRHNLSLRRFAGHYLFALDCSRALEQWKPERIHCLVPGNALAYEMARYKQKHPETRLYFDLNDLWPESFPLQKLKALPPFALWKRMRDQALPKADHIFLECGLFEEVLDASCQDKASVLYWMSSDDQPAFPWNKQKNRLSLLYLGSMANIMDMDGILALLEGLHEQGSKMTDGFELELQLIGSGPAKEELIRKASFYAVITDHGELYDPRRKHEILATADFGLNFMKPGVRAGLSMKSVDYLAAGLPVLNSLEGDLEALCRKAGIGLSTKPGQTDRLVPEVLALRYEKNDLYQQMRRNARAVFENQFSPAAFQSSLEQGIEQSECFKQERRDGHE